jgi:transcription antitermination factor NusA-like protein
MIEIKINDIQTIIFYLFLYGFWPCALFYLVLFPEKFEKLVYLFWKTASYVASIYPRVKRKFDSHLVAASIQDTINSACDKINKDSFGILPKAMKIVWVGDESPESFIDRGKVIVRLKNYANQDRNIVESTLLYLKSGFMPGSLNYLDTVLRKGCEYRIASKIFDARRDTGAFDYFIDNELTASLTEFPDLAKDLQTIENLDSVGFFTQVFLAEVKYTANKLMGTVPTKVINAELRNFAYFLNTIATKGRDYEVPLSFDGTKIKASVILVAKKERLYEQGIAPYLHRIKVQVRAGYENLYIAGWGEENVKSIFRIIHKIEKSSVRVLKRYDFHLEGTTKAVVFACQSNQYYLSQLKELQNEVLDAVIEHVPEFKMGDVEVISIARERGIGCKLAVKTTLEGSNINAVGIFIGENGVRSEGIKRTLQNEFVGIVEWSEDIKRYIINSLTPLKASSVIEINLDENQYIANVIVKTDHDYMRAIGKDGYNVKLASDLTGWSIRITKPMAED